MEIAYKPIKVFIPAPFRIGDPNLYLVNQIRRTQTSSKALFAPQYPFQFNTSEVSSLDSADIVLIPQPVTQDTVSVREYLDTIKARVQKNNLPLILMIGGDLSHRLFFDGYIVCKSTQYKRYKKAHEIVIPPICEDLGYFNGLNLREKGNTNRKPVVGFCGWAGFNSTLSYVKYVIKNFMDYAHELITFDSSLEIFRKGLYFRRRALRILSRSNKVETRFIVRKSFSGNARTISLSEEDARKEYVQNMIDSDFVLAPKGDANYSVRFFEALSLGRIPVLIDTETCLPLEDVIDYSKCILRVDYRDIAQLPDIIEKFYSSLSEEQFAAMQKAARAAFEDYLRYDSFFNQIFSRYIQSR